MTKNTYGHEDDEIEKALDFSVSPLVDIIERLDQELSNAKRTIASLEKRLENLAKQ